MKKFTKKTKITVISVISVLVMALTVGLVTHFARIPAVISDAATRNPEEVKTSDTVKALKGDADGNGKVEAADARIALRTAVGLETLETGSQLFKNADMNKDNEITAADARLILRLAVGLDADENENVTESTTENVPEESTTVPQVEESTTVPEEPATTPDETTTKKNEPTTEKPENKSTTATIIAETITDPPYIGPIEPIT